jgi:hypothetical protein
MKKAAKKAAKKAGKAAVKAAVNQAVRRRRPQGPSREPEVDTREIEAHVNPFCDFANGARIPDQGAGRTLTEQLRLTYTLTTDADGEAAAAFQPNPKYPFITGVVGASDITWDANWTASGGTFLTDLDEARVVSWGIRAFTTLSATNAQGRIQLSKTGSVSVGQVMANNASNYQSIEFHPLAHGAEFGIIPHPTGAEYQNFTDFQATLSTTTVDTNWQFPVFVVKGAPATTACVFLELFMNLEEIVESGHALNALTRRQPVYNPMLQAAVDHAQTQHTGLFRGAKDAIAREIKGHAAKAAKKHLPRLLEKGLAALAL